MKRRTPELIIMLLCLLYINGAYAQDTIIMNSKIEKVVIFLKGAQIKRKVNCTLLKGLNLLNFSKISSKPDQNSIQVSCSAGAVIQSVNFKVNYLDSISIKQIVKELQNRMDSLEYEKITLENNLYVLRNEEELLIENQVLGGEKLTVQTTELEKACNYFRGRLSEIASEKNKSVFRLRQIAKQNENLVNQLNELNSGKRKPVGEIWVLVNSMQAGQVDFNIEYFIKDAGWIPKYDIRAESLNMPANLGYKADVYQDTDEDWTNVETVLSSSNPMLQGTKPELQSWKLNVLEKYEESPDYSSNISYYDDLRNDFSSPIAVDNDMVISGRVVDGSDHSGIPGVSILIKGTSTGTVSNLEGEYTIKVPKGTKNITFSFIGYKTMELPITGQKVNCVLDADVCAMEEVVVTAYGIVKKSDLTGSSTILVNDGNGNFVNHSLQGSITGIRVRGISSDRVKKERKKAVGKSLEGLNKLKENQTSFEFTLDKPYTIPTDNKTYSVDIEKYEVPVEFQYSTVPKMDAAAFLIARLTDWENLNLLTGTANIYFEGSYVGSSTINTEKTDDTLTISMGRDKGIIIDRKMKSEFNKKQIDKKGNIETYTYEIELKNTKPEKISLVVEDQIPISYSKEIEVELTENNGATFDKFKGKLSWQIELGALEHKILTFSYKIKSKNI